MTIAIIVLFYVEFPFKFWTILILFLLASFTDHLDGHLARKWKVESTFGKVFDSLFDKILVLSLFMLLIPYGIVPSFIFVALLVREIFVDGLKNYLLSKGAPISARFSGKAKMCFQIAMIIFMLLYLIYPGNIEIYKMVIVMTSFALLFSYYSAAQYVRTFYRIMTK